MEFDLQISVPEDSPIFYPASAMRFLRVLILFSLIGSILPQQGTSQGSPLLIQSVELIRRGQQVTVHLLTNGPPVYEVNENLPAKTLVIKFQNARLDFVDGRNERLFNDEQIAGIRFNKVDDAIWAQFKLRLSELSYEIIPWHIIRSILL